MWLSVLEHRVAHNPGIFHLGAPMTNSQAATALLFRTERLEQATPHAKRSKLPAIPQNPSARCPRTIKLQGYEVSNIKAVSLTCSLMFSLVPKSYRKVSQVLALFSHAPTCPLMLSLFSHLLTWSRKFSPCSCMSSPVLRCRLFSHVL